MFDVYLSTGTLSGCHLPMTYHYHLCVSDLCDSHPNIAPLCKTIDDYIRLCEIDEPSIFDGKTAEDFAKCAFAGKENQTYASPTENKVKNKTKQNITMFNLHPIMDFMITKDLKW